METATYQCPLCGRKMERNLVLFLKHADQHVIDQVKKEHPEWVESDGACKPCAEYYRNQLSGASGEENIGPRGRTWRFWAGVGVIALSLGLVVFIRSYGASRYWIFFLALPFYGGLLGLIQAQEKTCALLAEQGLRDMDQGTDQVVNPAIRDRLRARGRQILLKAAFGTALLIVFLFII